MPTTPQAPPYTHVSQAYQHFKKDELGRGYAPYDERRDGDWVLVYFHQTQRALLFPTLESVSDWFAWDIYRHNVFLSPDELNARHTSRQLEGLLLKLGWEEPMPIGPKLAEAAWKLAQLQGMKHPKIRQSVGKPKSLQLYTVDIQALKTPEGQAKLATLPKQARVIGQAFAETALSSFTQEELDGFSRRLIVSGKLKTKQDPCRVVAYYLPTLSDLGFVTYPGRRKVEETAPQPGPTLDPEEVSEYA